MPELRPEARRSEQGELSSMWQGVSQLRTIDPFCSSVQRKKKHGMVAQQMIRAIVEETSDEDEVFCTQEIAANSLDDSQIVTLKLESGNYLRFQPDTGAQCNTIPVHLYKKASKDFNLDKVKPPQTAIAAYGGSKLEVVGRVRIRVWRGDFQCKLDCNLVNSTKVRPLLGRKACLGMKIVQYLDNDQMNKPATGEAPVYAVHGAEPQEDITKDQLLKQFPKAFGAGIGKLDGVYRIRLDHTVDPVQHAPRRVPVALSAQVKESLEDMVQQDIIAPVSTPTAWISSMVVVPKKNGKLRICLDPKRPETCNSARALSATNHRRRSNASSWGQSLYNLGCA